LQERSISFRKGKAAIGGWPAPPAQDEDAESDANLAEDAAARLAAPTTDSAKLRPFCGCGSIHSEDQTAI